MSVSFPRALPHDGARIASILYDIDWKTSHNPEGGGRRGAVSMADPLWRAEYQTTTHRMAQAAQTRAWLNSLRNGARTFIALDPSRRRPAAYPRGFTGMTRASGGAFDGTIAADDWSIDAGRTQLTLTRLPAGFALADADLVGLVWDGVKRALVEVAEGVTADGAGALTVEIQPPLPRWAPLEATIVLEDASCVMRLVPGSVDGPRVTAGNRLVTRWSAEESPPEVLAV